jgi:hypothetical protein
VASVIEFEQDEANLARFDGDVFEVFLVWGAGEVVAQSRRILPRHLRIKALEPNKKGLRVVSFLGPSVPMTGKPSHFCVFALTEDQWSQIQPLLSALKGAGASEI